MTHFLKQNILKKSSLKVKKIQKSKIELHVIRPTFIDDQF